MFSLDTPWYLGLGSIGFIIAHEIDHAISCCWNEQGNHLKNFDIKSQFEAKLECFVNQYSSDKFQIEEEKEVVEEDDDDDLSKEENIINLSKVLYYWNITELIIVNLRSFFLSIVYLLKNIFFPDVYRKRI